MNSDQLRYFASAYACRNFADAARSVSMSTQGFIKSIRSLESELNVPLFNHETRGVNVPTAYADALMEFVGAYRKEFDRLESTFDVIRRSEGREIRLTCSMGVMGYLGVSFVDTFKRLHPGITLNYTERSDYLCDDDLKSGKVDVALTLAPFDPTFESVRLYSTPTCFWVRNDDPLYNKERFCAKDLDGRKIAMPGTEFKCNRLIMDRFERAGCKPSSVTYSSTMFWLYNHTLEGNGPAYGVQHLARLPFFSDPSMKCIPFEDERWSFAISTRGEGTLNEAERAFADYCLGWKDRAAK